MKELKYHHLRASLPVTNSGEQERLCDIKYVILREGDVYKKSTTMICSICSIGSLSMERNIKW